VLHTVVCATLLVSTLVRRLSTRGALLALSRGCSAPGHSRPDHLVRWPECRPSASFGPQGSHEKSTTEGFVLVLEGTAESGRSGGMWFSGRSGEDVTSDSRLDLAEYRAPA
jgi:hypothetical protein